MGVTYSFLCSFKPFMIKPQQKKRPFWKSFWGNPLKAEISNTSGSKQALETSSTRDHMAKFCQDLQLLLELHAAFLRHLKCLSSAFETPQMLWGCSGCIYQPKQTTILTSLPGRFLGVMVPFQLMLFWGFLHLFPEGPTVVTGSPPWYKRWLVLTRGHTTASASGGHFTF